MSQVNATHIYAEEEVEHDLRKLMTVAKETLETLPFPEKGQKFVLWRTPFYDIEVIMIVVMLFFFPYYYVLLVILVCLIECFGWVMLCRA